MNVDADKVVYGSFEYATIKQPERSDWVCYLQGHPNGPVQGTITWRPLKHNTPNWFHRLMMRLFFGFIWVKKIES